MPQLDEKKYAQIAMMIDELEPLAADGDLPGNGNQFINDQVERKKQYGERMFLSSKQVNWIESLHREHVGSSEEKGPKGIDGKTGDMDDDVPF